MPVCLRHYLINPLNAQLSQSKFEFWIWIQAAHIKNFHSARFLWAYVDSESYDYYDNWEQPEKKLYTSVSLEVNKKYGRNLSQPT